MVLSGYVCMQHEAGGMLSTDNQYHASEDRFLVMAAVSRDLVNNSDKDKVEKAWNKVLKNDETKSRAEFMQHQ